MYVCICVDYIARLAGIIIIIVLLLIIIFLRLLIMMMLLLLTMNVYVSIYR